MKPSNALFTLVAAFPLVQGIAVVGSAPKATGPERVAQEVVYPEPTKAPSAGELRRRQNNLYPETCGWVDGDRSTPVTCVAAATCMLYKSGSFGMAGCCDGSDTQDCGWARQCIDYSAIEGGGCGSNCLQNSFIRKCSNAFAPYCVTWTYPSDGIYDYGCADTSTNTVYTVLARGTDGLGRTSSLVLPTVSGKAVTGFNAATGGGSQPTDTSDTTTSTQSVKKVAVGLIIGIVLVILFVIFVVVVGVLFCLKKKKKQQQIAANAQAVATAQASRPQSMAPTQPQMQGGFIPPMPTQSPQPTANGYFAAQNQSEQKFNPQASVYEYPQTPISNPPTPAPAYSQPYGTPNMPPAMPPMPTQPNAPYYHAPAAGVYEFDAGGVSGPPPQQVVPVVAQSQNPNVRAVEVDATSTPHAPSNPNPGLVYEMGSGR